MGTNNEEKRDKGQFVQFPLHLIYERKDLSRDDKWVLLSIMGTYWTEGPHRLSYREVAALSGVPLALLTSYLDKRQVSSTRVFLTAWHARVISVSLRTKTLTRSPDNPEGKRNHISG